MIVLRRIAAGVLAALFAAALLAGALAPAHYETQDREAAGALVSKAHPLGTDALGRDRLARLLYGLRVSLLMAPAAALVSTAIAAVLGALAGFAGGWLDRSLTRLTDLVLSLPWIFVLLIVRAALPLNVSPAVSLVLTFALLGLLGWAVPSRVVRASVAGLRDSDALLEARALGCRTPRLLARHILPNLRPVLAAQFCLAVPAFILSEANLSVLGLGVVEPLPSLGNLLRELESYDVVAAQPWLLTPVALLAVIVACFHLLVSRKESLA